MAGHTTHGVAKTPVMEITGVKEESQKIVIQKCSPHFYVKFHPNLSGLMNHACTDQTLRLLGKDKEID